MQAIPEIWLSIPQAVFLLMSGDIEGAQSFPKDKPDFLAFLVARQVELNPVFVPLESLGCIEQTAQALQLIKQKLADAPKIKTYDAGVKALLEILSKGLASAKGSRSLGGLFEVIDPVEFTRINFQTVNAIHLATKKIIWYEVRVSGHDLLELRRLAECTADVGQPLPCHNGIDRLNRSGAKPHPKWVRAREVAMEWLRDYGYPVPGDGNQAKLERHVASWLEEHEDEAGEATIRRHVAEWIREFREVIQTTTEGS